MIHQMVEPRTLVALWHQHSRKDFVLHSHISRIL
ncbi:unnamed protein product [Anisakis simplex]|uniref:Uncharacterized protein n=1 Tax=Anisakis simplex TaxID=6269 RepID=A0A0M3J564_ANISI|nr:unnamed protein product [Anisakis simplex]